MKLGKCKQALADLINANGGWVDGEAIFAAMDGNGNLFGYSGRPQWTVSHGHWYGHTLTCWFFSPVVMKNHHQTILSREEYYHAYPKADADGWIEWGGGECPVEAGSIVDVRYRDGRENFHVKAMSYDRTGSIKSLSATCWGNINVGSDIVAYRPHKPDVKPEFCESVMRSIPEPEFDDAGSRLAKALELVKSAAPHMLRDKYKFDGNEVMGERKPTIEQLAQDYRDKLDFAKRKQQEADEAKAAADAALSELERAGEEIGLLLSPIREGKKPEINIIDWRDLMVGDEIICSEDGNWNCDMAGNVCVVIEIESQEYTGCIPILAEYCGASDWGDKFTFVRRP